MADNVFINGRAAVHAGSAGKSIAFPDVCLCPPPPPSGPIPTPLPNTAQAMDLQGGAPTVTIEGNPVAHAKSFIAKSTGNEVATSTGGGVITHMVQGMAYFQTFSMDVFIEGQPAVRHMDLVTHNHMAMMPGNTPPAPWMSAMIAGPGPAPKGSEKEVFEGKDWIVLHFVEDDGAPLEKWHYQIKTPSGRRVSGRIFSAGKVSLRQIAKGNCEIVLPEADARAAELGQHKPAKATGDQKAYVPGSPLRLASGKEYVVVVPYTKSLWVDIPVRVDDPDARDDEFVLESKDGAFRAVKTIADDRIRGDRHLTLEFFGLEPGKRYTLMHHLGKDQPVRTIFEDQTYEDIFPRKPPKKKRQTEKAATIDIDPEMLDPSNDFRPIRLEEPEAGLEPLLAEPDEQS
jgi:hypothetical protein